MIASFIHGARVKLVDIIYNNYIILKQTGQKMGLLKSNGKSHRKSPGTKSLLCLSWVVIGGRPLTGSLPFYIKKPSFNPKEGIK
jgi:hypothetical protein